MMFYTIWTSPPAAMPQLKGLRVSLWLTETSLTEYHLRPTAAGRLLAPLQTGLLAGSEGLAWFQCLAQDFTRAMNLKRLVCFLLDVPEECNLATLKALAEGKGLDHAVEEIEDTFGKEPFSLGFWMSDEHNALERKEFALDQRCRPSMN